MSIPQDAMDLVKSFEGLRLEAYDDATEKRVRPGDHWQGTLTIGWGHIASVEPGQIISEKEAEAFLAGDLADAERTVDVLTRTVALKDIQRGALVSFQFNTGALKVSTTLKLLRKGDFQGAADALLNWSHGDLDHDGVKEVVPGLLKRRRAERALFLGQDWRTAS